MNRRSFLKGAIAAGAAAAMPIPVAYASGGYVTGGVDLGLIGDDYFSIVMLSRKNGKTELVSEIIRRKFNAGLAERSGIGLPSRLNEFDSRGPLHSSRGGVEEHASRFVTGSPCGVAKWQGTASHDVRHRGFESRSWKEAGIKPGPRETNSTCLTCHHPMECWLLGCPFKRGEA